MNMLNNGL